MLKINIILIILFLLLVSACSKGKETESQFIVSLSALSAGMTFNGGALLKISDPVTNVTTSYELTATNVVKLPHGKWSMYLVGFEGAAAWSGPYKCGVVHDVVLSLDAQTVEIIVDSDCTQAPFNKMISVKAPSPVTWDNGKWGEAKWGP